MSLAERLKHLAASQAEIEADEERADQVRAVGCTPVDQLPVRSRARVSGVIRSVTFRPREGVPALEAELYDGSGTLVLVWLGRREIAGVVPGRRLKAEGLVCLVDGRRTVFNPGYELRPRPGE
ncbi:OB-fold nucleic acid binding domain-containing protein [Cellulomonas edaphi]|uniref:OB-fold nucleic acid binding domain-containing protein n=1 Tax=Cellulomonas edaphi TaxID=3053468 RepID=A0ABT7S6X7_9CELL|nr:OB-fold nucleic acid binding domain-containing protein [Cellulomons edaphi]MDM7831373.1 OB-fold nucleic acid binding domain-containing protein [Cellulomons edaphi]